ncbi:ESPR-type extended signal peptide-containing protein, partial [Escherichia albertii]
MNKIFKVIWNPATGSYSVASETAKSRGKKSGRSKLLISALVAGGLLSSFGAYAGGLDGGESIEEAAGGTSITDGWIAIGMDALASSVGTGVSAIAIGKESRSEFGGTALGYQSHATGDRSLALGQVSKATGSRAIAIGGTAEASGDFSLALGNLSVASGGYAMAMGKETNASGLYSLAIGYKSESGGDNSLALGSQSRVNANNSVALGAGSEAKADKTVSVGNDSLKRKIVNMAAGKISDDSTEAINGSQLFAISESVATRLGGSSSVNSDGTVNAPSYVLKNGIYNNVGSALTGLDNNTLQWNGSNAFSASHGSSTTSKITNVTAGDLTATSTDAVNGSQLQATKDDVAANTTSITNLSNDVADNTTNITNLQDAVDGLGDDALQWDNGKTAFSAAHGASTTSKITNVTAGDLTATSTDAVNGAQLKATKDDVAANTTSITNLGNDVADNTTNITNLQDAVDGLGDDALQWDSGKTAFSAAHGAST